MLPPVQKTDVEAFYASFRLDVATFQQQLPQLLQEFPNQYVAILDGQIVDHEGNWKGLAESVQRRFPGKFVFIERVVPKEKVFVDMDTLEG